MFQKWVDILSLTACFAGVWVPRLFMNVVLFGCWSISAKVEKASEGSASVRRCKPTSILFLSSIRGRSKASIRSGAFGSSPHPARCVFVACSSFEYRFCGWFFAEAFYLVVTSSGIKGWVGGFVAQWIDRVRLSGILLFWFGERDGPWKSSRNLKV